MKSVIAIAAAVMAIGANAQLPDLSAIPQCALSCLVNQISASGCAVTDFACSCSSQTVITNSATCIYAGCSETDADKAGVEVTKLCKQNGGVDIVIPPRPGASSSAAPSSAAPSSAAPSSAAPSSAAPSSAAPSSAAPSSAAPSSAKPSSAAPSSAAPSSVKPSSAAPSCAAPSTPAPTSAKPSATPPTYPGDDDEDDDDYGCCRCSCRPRRKKGPKRVRRARRTVYY